MVYNKLIIFTCVLVKYSYWSQGRYYDFTIVITNRKNRGKKHDACIIEILIKKRELTIFTPGL